MRRLSPVLSARGRLGLAHYPRIFWAWRDWTAVGPDRDEEVYFLSHWPFHPAVLRIGRFRAIASPNPVRGSQGIVRV